MFVAIADSRVDSILLLGNTFLSCCCPQTLLFHREIYDISPSLPTVSISTVNQGPNILNFKIPEINFLSFKLCAIRSGVMKPHPVPPSPQDVNHPFVQHILSVSHSVAVRASYFQCSSHIYFTQYACSVAQQGPTLCGPMNSSLPGPSAHGIFQARTLEWGFLLQEIFPTQGLNLHLSHPVHQQVGSLLPAPLQWSQSKSSDAENLDMAKSSCRVLL